MPNAREVLTWIYRIATNYCLNELRNRRSRPEPRDLLPEIEADGAAWGAEERMADRDLARRLVQRAAPKLRSVAWLYHVDGLDQHEVARVLGVSRRTVVTRLRDFATNARKFMRRSAA